MNKFMTDFHFGDTLMGSIHASAPKPMVTNAVTAPLRTITTLSDLSHLLSVAKKQGADKHAKFKVRPAELNQFLNTDNAVLEVSWVAK